MLVCKVVQGFVLPPLDEIYFSHFYKFQSLAFEQRAMLLLAASRLLDDAKLLIERELFWLMLSNVIYSVFFASLRIVSLFIVPRL